MSLISRRSMLQASIGATGALSLSGLASAMQQNTSPHGRPKLKITDIRTAYVTVHGPQLHVRIYTEAGIRRQLRDAGFFGPDSAVQGSTGR